MPNILAFKTPDDGDFLVFGVSNAKYLAFDTLDRNVLIYIYLIKYVIFLSFFFYRRNMLFS